MRTLQIVWLLVAFVVAVVSPHDDVGTHDLPATGAKSLVKAAGHNWHKPRGHGQAALVPIQEFQCELLTSVSARIVWRSVRTVSNLQLSSPLLI
jgi:hypothetical protein